MTARRHILPVFGVLVTVAVLIGSAASVAAWRERWYPAPSAIDSTLDIQSGATLQQLTKGYNALAADLYWIRTIQYYGGGAPPFPLLYPLLDLTTTLDPSFNIAYRFGAIFLAEAPPRGPGRPDQAIRLLEKALRAHPGRWEYMQDIGFVHYWWTHDDDAAADWFDRAAHVPGAPWFLQTLAATT
ncbi:MAG: hypothetical protein LBQ09_07665, partial [Acidobacteriaceae bacterium]|nr:hypothetical protein [Acidobacteriaceae bacterium]